MSSLPCALCAALLFCQALLGMVSLQAGHTGRGEGSGGDGSVTPLLVVGREVRIRANDAAHAHMHGV